MQITKVTVKLITGKERIKASASIVFDDCFKVRDILIVPKGVDGDLRLVMPSKKIKSNRVFGKLFKHLPYKNVLLIAQHNKSLQQKLHLKPINYRLFHEHRHFMY